MASEVKDLAQETARATEDIARRVEAIQGDTAGVAGSARVTSMGVGEAQQTTAELARMSNQLSALVGRFRY